MRHALIEACFSGGAIDPFSYSLAPTVPARDVPVIRFYWGVGVTAHRATLHGVPYHPVHPLERREPVAEPER